MEIIDTRLGWQWTPHMAPAPRRAPACVVEQQPWYILGQGHTGHGRQLEAAMSRLLRYGIERRQGLCVGAVVAALLLAACGDAAPGPVADLGGGQRDGGGPLPDKGPSPPTDVGAPKPDTPPPPPPTRFSFVVFGDNQFATSSCTSGVPERLAIPEAVKALKPALVLHTGDLMDHGYDSGAYAKFASCYKSMLARHPFFPTMGNHDAGYTGIKNYKKFLEQRLFTANARAWGAGYKGAFKVAYNDDPTPYSQSFSKPSHKDRVPSGVSFKTFYALKHKNAYFISFEQGTRWWANTPKPWVEKHLKLARADKSIRHIFVTMHHPMYSTTMNESPPNPKKPSSGECIQPVRKHYEALFRKYDVTMVFAGHAHLYDHFYVPDDNHQTRKSPPPNSYPHDGKAVHYVVTGGGGGGLNKCNWKKQHSYKFFQHRGCMHHVTRVVVNGGRLDVSIVKVKGSASSHTTSVFDSFTIK